MRIVLQRVKKASVRVDGTTRGEIGVGILVYLGVGHGDTAELAREMAVKCADLRVFEDEGGKMNLSVKESGGAALVISQFTLYGDCRKGRRPNFIEAAAPAHAEPIYRAFIDALRGAGLTVGHGVFGAMMEVESVNDGPVTLVLEKAAEPLKPVGKSVQTQDSRP